MQIAINEKRLKTISRKLRGQLGLDAQQSRVLLDTLAQGLGYKSHGALRAAIVEARGTEEERARPEADLNPIDDILRGKDLGAAVALTPHDIACYLAVDDTEDGEPEEIHLARAETWLLEKRNSRRLQDALDRKAMSLAEDAAGLVPEIELFEIVDPSGRNVHGEREMPWEVHSFTLFTGPAIDAVKAWVDTQPDLTLQEIGPDDVEDPEIVTWLPDAAAAS